MSKYRLEPYLHFSGREIYNPLTDQSVSVDDEVGRYLTANRGTCTPKNAAGLEEELSQNGWLIPPDTDPDRRFNLQYVSIETYSPCNQSCDFCPVSVSPRPAVLMPQERFTSLLENLRPYRSTLKGVFLNFYNEPSIDPLFLERIKCLQQESLPIALLTNASGLSPAKVDQIRNLGLLGFLSINLSTMDAQEYADTRGRDHLKIVLRNLDYICDHPIADQSVINVMGEGNEKHNDASKDIAKRYSGYFDIRPFTISSRCGASSTQQQSEKLSGCDQMGSRVLQHLHVTANGDCVICCQDYYEEHKLGNVFDRNIEEILTSDDFAKIRRQVYGIDDASTDFICRRCEYALK